MKRILGKRYIGIVISLCFCTLAATTIYFSKSLAATTQSLAIPTVTASDGIASGRWHTGGFTLKFGGFSDQSGIKYYYSRGMYSTWNEASSINISNSDIKGDTYYVKACLNISTGNCGDYTTYIVNVDTSVPSKPVITASDGIASGGIHTDLTTLTMSGVGSSISGISYYYGKNGPAEVRLSGNTFSIGVGTYYTFTVKACNSAGTCSGTSSYVFKSSELPKINPKITASDGKSSGNWHNKSFKLNFSGVSNGTGIKYYYSKDINSSWIQADSLTLSSNTNDVTYYVKACSSELPDICTKVSSYNVKLDLSTPKAPTVKASDSVGSGSTHFENFTLKFSGSSSISGVNYYYSIDGGNEKVGNSLDVTGANSGQTVSVRACNGAGTCSSKTEYKIKFKNSGSPTTPKPTDPNPGNGDDPVITPEPSPIPSDSPKPSPSSSPSSKPGTTQKPSGNTPTKKSDNNNLSSLEIDGYALEEIFNSNTLNYTVIIPKAITSINIRAVSEHNKATVVGSGIQKIPDGDKVLKVVVTSESGISKEYTITIIQKEIETKLLSLRVEGFQLNEAFSPDKTAYTLTVPYETTSIKVDAVAVDKNNQVIIQRNDNLSVGKNVVQIFVKNSSGQSSKYTIMVTREAEKVTTVVPDKGNNNNFSKFLPFIIGGVGIVSIGVTVFGINYSKKKKRVQNFNYLNNTSINPSNVNNNISQNNVNSGIDNMIVKKEAAMQANNIITNTTVNTVPVQNTSNVSTNDTVSNQTVGTSVPLNNLTSSSSNVNNSNIVNDSQNNDKFINY